MVFNIFVTVLDVLIDFNNMLKRLSWCCMVVSSLILDFLSSGELLFVFLLTHLDPEIALVLIVHLSTLLSLGLGLPVQGHHIGEHSVVHPSVFLL